VSEVSGNRDPHGHRAIYLAMCDSLHKFKVKAVSCDDTPDNVMTITMDALNPMQARTTDPLASRLAEAMRVFGAIRTYQNAPPPFKNGDLFQYSSWLVPNGVWVSAYTMMDSVKFEMMTRITVHYKAGDV